MEAAADLGADRPDDVEEEARAVGQRAAVLVLAVVDARAQELGEQIAVGGVQLDAVEARFARPPGAAGEGADRVVDLRPAHRPAQEAVQQFLAAGRRQNRPRVIVHARDVHLPPGMGELHDEFAVVEAVHGFAERLPVGDELVAVDGGVAGDDAAFHQHRHVGRDDGAGTALGEHAFPVDASLGQRAVFVVEPARDARAENPVLDPEIAKLQRRENDVLIHSGRPSLSCGATPPAPIRSRRLAPGRRSNGRA